MKRQVLLLISQLGLGGTQRQLLLLADRLRTTHDVVVGYLLPTAEPVDVRELLREKGLEVLDFSMPPWNNPILQILIMALTIRRRKIDVIQTFLYRANILGAFAGILGGASRIIASVRGIGSWNRSSRSVAHALIERIAFLFVNKVTCNAEAVKEYVVRRGTPPEKIEVIHNGLEFEVVRPSKRETQSLSRALFGKKREQTLIVGSVTRLDPQKDIPNFLRAAQIVHSRVPTARFLIIGGGIEQKHIESTIQTLGASHFIHLVGHVMRPHVHISLFDVAVLSSSAGEGLSNFVMEAMAQGKPVVLTDVGGARELVVNGENGYVVTPRNPEALAEKILGLLGEKKLRIEMGRRSLERIRDLADPAVMVQAYRELYSEPSSK